MEWILAALMVFLAWIVLFTRASPRRPKEKLRPTGYMAGSAIPQPAANDVARPTGFTDKTELDNQMRPYREARTHLTRLLRKADKAAKPVNLLQELDNAIPEAARAALAVAQLEQNTFLQSENASNRFFEEMIDFQDLMADLQDARAAIITELFFQLEEKGIVQVSETISDSEMERVVREHFSGLTRD